MKTCILGASGYTGSELAKLIQQHPQFSLETLFVSENSEDANKKLGDIHGHLNSIVDLPLTPLTQIQLANLGDEFDLIFLATPHQASHDWMPILLNKRAKVFDLSGAFRLQDTQVFADFYGFEHQHQGALSQAVYGLAEWYKTEISNADFVAVPGCYPTASLLATKPLIYAELLDCNHWPIVNAVSGVSGAGRKATLTNSLCEVSLQAYGVLSHRHTPEISAYLGQDVIFTPHLGNFKRGILATITCRLKYGVKATQIEQVFSAAYADKAMIRLLNTPPKLDNVVGQPFCDLYWQYDQSSGYMVITSAIDNLLKGAASQAVQCANLRFGLADTCGLLERGE
jgi:N-acetyl-gamma-glutamyl-phosphate reductase